MPTFPHPPLHVGLRVIRGNRNGVNKYSSYRNFFCPNLRQSIHSETMKCCWNCVECKENQVVLDEYTCMDCEKGWWPNENLTGNNILFILCVAQCVSRFISAECLIFSYLNLCIVSMWFALSCLTHNSPRSTGREARGRGSFLFVSSSYISTPKDLKTRGLYNGKHIVNDAFHTCPTTLCVGTKLEVSWGASATTFEKAHLTDATTTYAIVETMFFWPHSNILVQAVLEQKHAPRRRLAGRRGMFLGNW